MVVHRLNCYRVYGSGSFERSNEHSAFNCSDPFNHKYHHMRHFHFLFIFSILVLFTNCSGQTNNAVEAQKLANEIREKTAVPGESPNANLYMKAVINGKSWTADKLIPDEDKGSSNYHVNGSADGTTIAFYVYTTHIKAGDVYKFGESNTADFITNDEVVFYGGRKGNFEVTKVDNEGFEGKFYFDATSSGAPGKFVVTAFAIF